MAMIVSAAKYYVPGGDFESWTTDSVLYPQSYQYNSSLERMSKFIQNSASPNVERTTSSYAQNYAIKLSTVKVGSDTLAGYLLNASPNDGAVSTWHGGVPISEKPTGLKGYYMYNEASADSALVIVVFSKAGQNIGTYTQKIGGIHSTYTPFNVDCSSLGDTPDSVIVAFASTYKIMSDEAGLVGGTLYVDSVSFTGVASQPAALNGSFESWADSTVNVMPNWYTQGHGESLTGVKRTTNAYGGQYALELRTYAGTSDNGSPKAMPGYLSTGYYDSNCNGNCTQHGGVPYSQELDTLCFFYKYSPSGNDSAQVSVNLKQGGSSVSWHSVYLSAASNWAYVEVPIAPIIILNPSNSKINKLGIVVPDTVIVTIQSSVYADSAVSFVGSTLIVDNMYFKSQLLSALPNVKADNAANIYPNPASDAITITGVDGPAAVSIMDISGKTIFAKSNVAQGQSVSVASLPQGVYLVKIETSGGSIEKKLVKK